MVRSLRETENERAGAPAFRKGTPARLERRSSGFHLAGGLGSGSFSVFGNLLAALEVSGAAAALGLLAVLLTHMMCVVAERAYRPAHG